MKTIVADKLKQFDDQIEALVKQREECIDEATEQCEHPEDGIFERPYRIDFGSVQPPWLICSVCGLTEQGWRCGYKELKHGEHNGLTMNDKKWSKLKTKMLFQDDRVVYA